MSIALSDFWTRLVRAGLAEPADCKRYAAAFRDATGAPPADVASLAKFLVRQGELSEYQAHALAAPSVPRLRFGPLLRTAESAPPPWSGWIPVRHRESGERGLLRRVEPSHESAEAARRQAQVEAGELAAVRWLPGEAEEGFVFVPLPAGQLLYQRLAERPSMSPEETVRLGLAVAAALRAMHRGGLVHGDVRPDRVWMTDQGACLLLRDPSGPWPIDPAARHGWLDDLESPSAYAAPERFSRQSPGEPAGDLYSLGCLLFRLRLGRMPFAGPDPDRYVAQHRSEVPEVLAEAVRRGAAGDPLLRVIAFAMAKRPAARFDSASSLAKALAAVDAVDAPVSSPSAPAESSSEKPAAQGLGAVPPRSSGESQSAAPRGAAPAAAERGSSATSSRRRKKPAGSQVSAGKSAAATRPKTPAAAAPKSATRSPAPSTRVSRPVESVSAGSPATEPSTPRGRPPRRRRKRTRLAPLVLGGLGFTVLALVVVLLVRDPASPPPAEATRPRPRPPRSSTEVAASVAERSVATEVDRADEPANRTSAFRLVDDERLLWVPPDWSEQPPSTRLLPPGPGVIVSLRLSRWLQPSESPSWIERFTPELMTLIEEATKRTRVPPNAIRRLSVALHRGDGGFPEVSLAVELTRPRPLDELLEAWQVAAARTPEGATIYAGDQLGADAYFVPSQGIDEGGAAGERPVERFAVGRVERIREVAETGGAPIPLPRTLEGLWKGASDRADLVVLATPNFLFADGRQLLIRSVPEMVDPLKGLLVPDAAGWLLGVWLDGDRVYAESRMTPSGTVSAAELVRRLQDAAEASPRWAESFLVRSVPAPSWRLLASRFPQMTRFAVDHVRFGVVDGAAVANLYLPTRGASQLALATLLAMNTSPSSPGPTAEPPAPALSLEMMLDREMSVSFGQESLHSAFDLIMEEFARSLPAGIEPPHGDVLGSDLEKMGITQNQQVRDFDKRDLPLRRVLTDLVLGANPDRTATGPSDPKQTLVWVVGKHPQEPDRKAILITTRQAAAGNYQLPREFRAAGSSEEQ